MSFFSDIFKRKPGGTFFGNLIRGVAKSAAGLVPVVGGALSNVVGNGGMEITQQDADRRDLTDVQYEAKYGVKKDNSPIPVFNQYGQQMLAAAAGGAVTSANNYQQSVGVVGVNGGAIAGFFQSKAWEYLKWILPAAAAFVAYRVWKHRNHRNKHI